MNTKEETKTEDLVKKEARSIFLVSGEQFFSCNVILPEDQSLKDLRSFAEITLESHSPFPMEQLFWGFYYKSSSKSLFIYALYKENLDKEFLETVANSEFVFPSFFSGILRGRFEDSVSFIHVGSVLTAITWNANNPVPLAVESIKIETPEITVVDVLKAREALIGAVKRNGFVPEPGYWTNIEVFATKNSEVKFVNQHIQDESTIGETEIVRLTVRDDILWNGDIREKEFLKEKRRSSTIGRVLWKTLVVVAGLLVLCTVSEAVLLAGYTYLSTQKSTIDKRAANVAEIESQDTLVNKIEQLSHDYYTPFKMLELLNTYRPKKLFFNSITLGSTNELSLEGSAANVDEVNSYSEKLKQSGLVEKMEVSEIVSQKGKINFKMALTFKIQPKQQSTKASTPAA